LKKRKGGQGLLKKTMVGMMRGGGMRAPKWRTDWDNPNRGSTGGGTYNGGAKIYVISKKKHRIKGKPQKRIVLVNFKKKRRAFLRDS